MPPLQNTNSVAAFTLVESIVVLAVLTVGALGMVQLLENYNRGARSAELTAVSGQVIGLINTVIGNPKICDKVFGGGLIDLSTLVDSGIPVALSQLKIDETPLVQVKPTDGSGFVVRKLGFSKIISDLGLGSQLVNLHLEGEKVVSRIDANGNVDLAGAMGGSIFNHDFQLVVALDASKKIIKCGSKAALPAVESGEFGKNTSNTGLTHDFGSDWTRIDLRGTYDSGSGDGSDAAIAGGVIATDFQGHFHVALHYGQGGIKGGVLSSDGRLCAGGGVCVERIGDSVKVTLSSYAGVAYLVTK